MNTQKRGEGMKLVTFSISTLLGDVRRLGAIRNDGKIVDLNTAYEMKLNRVGVTQSWKKAALECPSDMLSFIQKGAMALDAAKEAMTFTESMTTDLVEGKKVVFDVDSIQILTPLPKPNSIRCFSLSEKHMLAGIAAMQDTADWGDTKPSLTTLPPEWYNLPTYYKTGTTEIYGPGDVVPWPSLTGKFDYELEIAVVIGKQGRNVDIENGEDYIFGYTMYNDWSARDFQNREMSVNLGPGLCKDNASSLGPCIVTKDEFDLYNSKFTVKVNGELWAETKVDFYFPLKKLVAYVTEVQTIYPGDIFTSGTLPGGSGAERKRWIPEEATIEFEGEGMGILRNKVGKRGEAQMLPAAQRPSYQMNRTDS
jgi:2-keto-4-pentenoate hydratase/2-oxohepta-3-ene-1,7-dioic acid hydratase in catechol pathway